jgi:hypothetical protein
MNKKYIIPAIILGVGLILLFRNRASAQPTSLPTGGQSDSFPLGKGSRGANVTRLQLAILNKDSKALPKFGADGIFGAETEAAAMKLLGKSSGITESDVQKLLS